jgi:adenylate cyclase
MTQARTIDTGHPLEGFRAWQRAHIRLTTLYGSAVLFTLVMMGVAFYKLGVDFAIASLQQRLLATTTSLASAIDGDAIAAIPVDSSTVTPLHQELLTRFAGVAQQDPDVETVYVLRPTEEPTKLRFLVDFVKSGDPAKPGERYEASELPILLKGFAAPAVEQQPYTDKWGPTLSGYAPIVDSEGRSVGLVGVDVKVVQIAALRRQVMMVVAAAFGAAFVLLSLASILVARSVRKPLTKLIEGTEAIARGELTTRIAMQRKDEFGVVARHFDAMAEALQDREFLRETFGRYVSKEVAKVLLERPIDTDLKGEERVVTVLISDIRGYSTISERLPPVHVVDMLNRYLSVMTDVIDEQQGCVIELLGDAILAVFGAPSYLPDHSERAVRCALRMRERLVELNREWRQSGLSKYWHDSTITDLSERIGIHTGPVVAGNLGGRSRLKYSVIGDTVNVAARLEALNKELDTDLLVSEQVFVQLPNDLLDLFQDQGVHKVKGRQQSVQVFGIPRDKSGTAAGRVQSA